MSHLTAADQPFTKPKIRFPDVQGVPRGSMGPTDLLKAARRQNTGSQLYQYTAFLKNNTLKSNILPSFQNTAATNGTTPIALNSTISQITFHVYHVTQYFCKNKIIRNGNQRIKSYIQMLFATAMIFPFVTTNEKSIFST